MRRLSQNDLTFERVVFHIKVTQPQILLLALYKHAVWQIRNKSKRTKKNDTVEVSMANYFTTLAVDPTKAVQVDIPGLENF